MTSAKVQACSSCAHWRQHYGPPEQRWCAGELKWDLGWKLWRCGVMGYACGPTVMGCSKFKRDISQNRNKALRLPPGMTLLTDPTGGGP